MVILELKTSFIVNSGKKRGMVTFCLTFFKDIVQLKLE